MDNLRRQTRNIHQKGAYVYGVVEDIKLGFATVRLTGGGARLTNLPVVGGAVVAGQQIIVDYSAGIPPVVRPVAEIASQVAGEELQESPEVTANPRTDHSCRLRLTTTTPVAWDTWVTISWDEAEYQTDSFWSSGTDITLPIQGVYFFIVDLSWGPSHDHWNEVHLFGDGMQTPHMYDYEPLSIDVYNVTTDGTIGSYTDRPITSEPTVGKLMQVAGSHYAASGEVIQIKAYQRTRLSSMDLVPHIEEGAFIAPRVTVQWMSDKE